MIGFVSPTSRTSRAVGAACLVLVAVLARYHAYLSPDATAVNREWYYVHQTDALLVEQAAREGSLLPFWNPWVQAGAPLASVPTKAFTYPPFVIGVRLLGPYLGMNVLALLHLCAGGIGTLLLGRRVGLGVIASTLSALLFVLAANPAEGFFMAPFGRGYAVAWWPFTTLALLRVLQVGGLGSGLVLGLCAAAQVHAGGEISMYWFAFLLLPIVASLAARRWDAAQLKRVGVACVVAAAFFLGLCAIVLLPDFAWVEVSGRGGALDPAWGRDPKFESLHEELGRPNRFITLAHGIWMSNGRGGILVQVFGLALGLFVLLRDRFAVGLGLGTGVCLLLATGTWHEWAFEFLPGYGKIRWYTGYLLPAGFGVLLISGYGFDAVLKRLRTVPGFGPWLQGGAVALVVSMLVLDPNAAIEPWASATERLDSARPFYEDATNAGYGRILQRKGKEQAVWTALELESTAGALGGAGTVHPLYAAWIPKGRTVHEQETENRFLLDALNVRHTYSRVPLSAPHLELLFQPNAFAEEAHRMHRLSLPRPFVYRRSGVLSRASVVDAPILVHGRPADRAQALREATSLPGVAATTHVFVEVDERLEDLTQESLQGASAVLFAGRKASDPALLAWHRRIGRGHLFRRALGVLWVPRKARRATSVRSVDDAHVAKRLSSLTVDLGGLSGDYLLVSELMTLHPGWTAKLDGQPAELLRADGLITAVRLTPDARHASFRFVPPGFVLGAWISAVTCVAGCVAGIWVAARGRAA